MTEMERTMLGQPEPLERIRADMAPVAHCAERIHGRRMWVVGTGTSWHAANIGAFWLRLAGVDASALQAVRPAKPRLVAHALSLPGGWEDHPWEETVVKVGRKVFVFFGQA